MINLIKMFGSYINEWVKSIFTTLRDAWVSHVGAKKHAPHIFSHKSLLCTPSFAKFLPPFFSFVWAFPVTFLISGFSHPMMIFPAWPLVVFQLLVSSRFRSKLWTQLIGVLFDGDVVFMSTINKKWGIFSWTIHIGAYFYYFQEAEGFNWEGLAHKNHPPSLRLRSIVSPSN